MRMRSPFSFGRNRHGGVAVWSALLAPPLLALATLAVDIARVYSLEAEMQSAADALARAGAVELDGRSDAITRAERAVNQLVANDQRFANGGAQRVRVAGIRFLSTLPANDSAAVTNAQLTSNPSLARFVEVTALPEKLTTFFPPKLISGLVTTTVTARSIGARHARMCGAAPLFICNPVEGDASTTLTAALDSPDYRGRLIMLRGKGASPYGPGQYGFLEPPGGNGANELKDMFAEVSPATCFDSAGVTLRTGMVSSVDQGVNTRFGIAKGSYKKGDYPEAQVTTSYPQDDCFAAGTCSRLGNGVWNFRAYMKATHPTKGSVDIAGTTYTFNHAANTVTPSNTRPTRYQVYRWEIETVAGQTLANPDRRILPVAVLNCQSENLSAGNVPVASFAKVFLTEPMGEGSENVIWGELVGPLKVGADVQARDQVDVRR